MKTFWQAAIAVAALMSGSAMAADMPVKARPIVEVYNWSGFYGGINVGASFGRSNNDWTNRSTDILGGNVCQPQGNALCAAGSNSNFLNGVLGGFQVGYNVNVSRYLFGLEADFDLTAQKSDTRARVATYTTPTTFNGIPIPGDVNANYTQNLRWLSTIRGRVGYTTDQWLFYATGGLAIGRVSITGYETGTGFEGFQGCPGVNGNTAQCPLATFGAGETRIGWAVGAGVESILTGNWTWKFEYLHVDLGRMNVAFPTLQGCFGGSLTIGNGTSTSCFTQAAGNGTVSSRITDEIFRFGLNYRFPTGAIVARY